MRRLLLFFTICFIFFLFPLQVFIIGDAMGIGVQGAVYRYQVTQYGSNFFPITREIEFALNGTLSSKTTLSVLLWVAGTILLACTLFFSFIHSNDKSANYYKQIVFGLLVSCVVYLCSCIVQYGFLFSGAAGLSLPVGILLILMWVGIIYFFKDSVNQFIN